MVSIWNGISFLESSEAQFHELELEYIHTSKQVSGVEITTISKSAKTCS